MAGFWLPALVMAAVLAAAIGWPLVRSRAGAAGAADVEVFRDQLRDLDREVERGVIGGDEARSLRLEIQRRLLAADARAARRQPASGWLPRGWPFAAALGLLLIAGSVVAYVTLGAPGVPDQPLAQRQDGPAAHQMADVARMAEALRARLEQDPDQVEGWLLLGRTYRTLERLRASAEAFGRAVQAGGRSAELLSAYGGALVLADDGIVSQEARAAFEEAVAKEPFDGRARFYIGLAAAQAGDTRQAMQTWTDLIALSPPDAPWLPQVRSRLADLGAKSGIDPAAIKPSPGLPKR